MGREPFLSSLFRGRVGQVERTLSCQLRAAGWVWKGLEGESCDPQEALRTQKGLKGTSFSPPTHTNRGRGGKVSPQCELGRRVVSRRALRRARGALRRPAGTEEGRKELLPLLTLVRKGGARWKGDSPMRIGQPSGESKGPGGESNRAKAIEGPRAIGRLLLDGTRVLSRHCLSEQTAWSSLRAK